MNIENLESPFRSGHPVKMENFTGRIETLKKIIRYTPKVFKNETQHFFITGNKGMGKTSICDYVIEYLSYEKNFACAYVSNKDNDSIEMLASRILAELLNNVPRNKRQEKLKTWFGDHVKELEIVGTKLRFDVDNYKQQHIREDFMVYLAQAFEDLKQDYDAMLIVIDDINGLSHSKDFVNWYKRMADTLIVNRHYRVPAYFVLAGYPEKFDDLVDLDMSFGRIFNYDHVDTLDDEDVKEFFKNTFENIGIRTDEESLNLMVHYSSGVPLTMQQVGESVFWNLEKDRLSTDEVKHGILNAAHELRTKQIRKTLNKIKSDNYEEMLIIIASKNISRFSKEDLNDMFSLSAEEVDNFVEKMLNIGLFTIFEDMDGDEYAFYDQIYNSYYRILADRDILSS